MTDEDRRRYDPFAPHSLVGAVAPPEQSATQVDDEQHDEAAEPDYEAMKKPELVDLAKKRGLPSYGSAADIIDRLRG